MPVRSATSAIGHSSAACAISRLDTTGLDAMGQALPPADQAASCSALNPAAAFPPGRRGTTVRVANGMGVTFVVSERGLHLHGCETHRSEDAEGALCAQARRPAEARGEAAAGARRRARVLPPSRGRTGR